MTTSCPVCQGPAQPFLHRSGVPVHQNLPLPSRTAALAIPRGELALVACSRCGFVSNAGFDPDRVLYGEGYENAQNHSPAFQNHMDALVARLTRDAVTGHCRVIEIGSGQGQFLKQVLAAEPAAEGLGFDPSYTGPATDMDGRLRFERGYYGPDYAHVPADVVICRHVIEHVSDPRRLLATVKQALTGSPQARVFFETPCVEWILRHRVIWDFFYEHCSYFTADSLAAAFELEGFQVDRIDHVFAGQYLWLEARLADGPHVLRPIDVDPHVPAAYAQDEVTHRQRWRERLQAARAQGGVALWGAGAKGVTLAHLIDPDCQLIDCVVDINPGKQGRFVPGTGHPIISPQQLVGRGIRAAVMMNPNYRDEIAAELRRWGLDMELME